MDEVLAVGDTVFQQRCLGKMGEVARGGRTVLFVSHNLAAIRTLCQRVLLIADGQIMADGSADDSIGVYLRSIQEASEVEPGLRVDRRGSGRTRLLRVRITGEDGLQESMIATGRPVRLAFEYDRYVPGVACSFTVYDRQGTAVAAFDSAVQSPEDRRDAATSTVFVCEIDELPLLPGEYRINAAAMVGDDFEDHVEGAAFLEVGEGHWRGRPAPAHPGYGSVCITHRWRRPIGHR